MRLFTLLGLAFASIAMAQGPGPRGIGGPQGGQPQASFTELKTYLGITDAQIQQIQTAAQTAQTNASALMTQIRTKRAALQDLLDKGTTDAAAVGKLMLEIQALQKQAQQIRENIQSAAVSLLSADQKAKLKGLEDAQKLQPAIQQAFHLGLLEPSAPAQGPMGRFGRGMPGPGMGPMHMGPMHMRPVQ